ncbi:class I SAM-dependent methyltransferase [Actinacidiphila paucisporea]|uniref:Methyltransferase domain-containing protein n=1 Tax=Actinacidiphila paucisporea TaxID=310782 RepID=A0A1M7N4L2_9ACTN|nr:class I SAM-dependent methyltransferase [Actinacidiphila paucisporea]SHM98428.1 hypothetical protein SAMN05216499_117134 [Actinacidiphila paucisporea]
MIGSFAPSQAPAVIEIGAGTGMFCTAMARWLSPTTVIGIDPSPGQCAGDRRDGVRVTAQVHSRP